VFFVGTGHFDVAVLTPAVLTLDVLTPDVLTPAVFDVKI
jgi:hypothetical protein